jgi:hypothetical protein
MPNLYYLIRSFNGNTRSDFSSTNANEILASFVTEKLTMADMDSTKPPYLAPLQ